MEKISCCITAHNEEEQLPALFDSIKGIDDIVLVDFESTDKTAEVAKSLGARVIKGKNAVDYVKKEDISEFKKRYGFTPHFKERQKVRIRYLDHEFAQSYAKHDWVYAPDCDEIIKCDWERIKKLLPEYDMIVYKFIQEHNADGTPAYWFRANRIFRRSKTWWTGRLHEGVMGHNLRMFMDLKNIVVDHWQRPKKDRETYLSLLEFNYFKDQSTRDAWYLGREYFVKGFYNEAHFFLNIYLETAKWEAEIAKAYQILARIMWYNSREEEAYSYMFKALHLMPNNKESLILMADLSRPKNGKYWRKFAETIPEEDHEL